jgi:hypothetical protein
VSAAFFARLQVVFGELFGRLFLRRLPRLGGKQTNDLDFH